MHHRSGSLALSRLALAIAEEMKWRRSRCVPPEIEQKFYYISSVCGFGREEKLILYCCCAAVSLHFTAIIISLSICATLTTDVAD